MAHHEHKPHRDAHVVTGISLQYDSSEDADVENTPLQQRSYVNENLLRSSFVDYQDVGNDEATADDAKLSFFTSTDYDSVGDDALRTVRDVNPHVPNELPYESETDELNEVPEVVDTDQLSENVVEDNILVGGEDEGVDSENTILLSPDSRGRGDLGILLAPETSRHAHPSIATAEEATVEDEEVADSTDNILNIIFGSEVNTGNADVEQERVKRSQDIEKSTKTATRRVKTGDTILNIRGAVRDAIGDAGAAPGPRASTRLDAFVIRPAPPAPRTPPAPPAAQEQQDDPKPEPLTAQVRKQERELLVAAHAAVSIPCDLTNVTHLRWYKDNERVCVQVAEGTGAGADGSLHIARAARAHAARWRCAGLDGAGRARAGRPTRLLVHEPVRAVYLAVDGRRLDAGNTWVPVRDKTVLEVRCVAEGGVPAPELAWRLLATEPALDHRPYLRVYQTNSSIEGVRWSRAVVTAARELHNATLRCAATQRRPAPPSAHDDLTAQLEMHVTYPPSFVISRWPGFGARLAAGGAAALRCDVDANPPARAHWLRDDDTPASSPTPLEGGGGGGGGSATLRWAALSVAHAGWYRCRASWLDAEYSSIGYYLNVLSAEELQPQGEAESAEEPEHQKVDVPLGGNVQLHCPKGSVGCWWRRVVGNASDSWAPAGSHHAHGVLGIRGALYQEAGEYRCVGARGADLQRLRDLKRVTLRVTGGASASAAGATAAAGGWRLECVACGRGVRALWLRGARAWPAPLAPHPTPLCRRAVLLLPDPDEVWCVAVTSTGAAVAVFPARSPPAPARHAQPGRPPSARAPLVPLAPLQLMALPALLSRRSISSNL
ncbi:uncharacterized protein tei [Battus philenor]|uniref:uncharacterized protein tei n=1 Tax=Battus philenor TaxID=42288 RepID=UPI0035CEE10D